MWTRVERSPKVLGAAALMAFCLALSQTATGRPVEASQLPRSELFTFHSDAFVNLHHFLYRWAEAGPGVDRSQVRRGLRVFEDDLERHGTLSEEQRSRWGGAVLFYRTDIVQRSLLFDEGMVERRRAVAASG